MLFRFRDVVGTYRLFFSDELRAFVERAFVEPAPEAARDAIRAEALAEAEGSELEITPDGRVVSRAHGQDFYSVRVDPDPDREYAELTFAKPDSAVVRLVLRDADTVLAHQPAKPIAEFRRFRKEAT